MLSMCKKKTHQGGKRVLEVGTVYVEFRVCFVMAMYEIDMFCYARHTMHLLVLFAIPKSIFIRQERLKRFKQC